jgi:hypothetical protein
VEEAKTSETTRLFKGQLRDHIRFNLVYGIKNSYLVAPGFPFQSSKSKVN